MLDYVRAGREAYLAVSEFTHGPYGATAPLLRKLSEHFELCLFALHQVRADLDRMQAVGFHRLRQRLWDEIICPDPQALRPYPTCCFLSLTIPLRSQGLRRLTPMSEKSAT